MGLGIGLSQTTLLVIDKTRTANSGTVTIDAEGHFRCPVTPRMDAKSMILSTYFNQRNLVGQPCEHASNILPACLPFLTGPWYMGQPQRSHSP